MRFHAILERDPETGRYTATVAGLPNIFVDAATEEEALRLVRAAIEFALDEGAVSKAVEPGLVGGFEARVVPVDV